MRQASTNRWQKVRDFSSVGAFDKSPRKATNGLPAAALPPHHQPARPHQTRKTIATHLGLSEQTVNGYVKSIFKHFGVHSQAELIARFTRGDGRDA